MPLEEDLDERRKRLVQVREEQQRLELTATELEAGIAYLERQVSSTAIPIKEEAQVAPPFSIDNMGASEAALTVLRGNGGAMTIDDVHLALRKAGRSEDREAVGLALAYLVRVRKAIRVRRGTYARR